jgi:D-amino-acid dehydrogenase
MTTLAIIGGGITGVTTAYALAKRGYSVTLFERHRYAAMETSFANGMLKCGTTPAPSSKA